MIPGSHDKRRVVTALALLAVSPMAARALGAECDTELRPVAGPTAYRLRGNRCEGLYESKVGASRLELVGLVRGAVPELSSATGLLRLTAPGMSKGQVQLRAVARQLRTYYRMDAQVPAGSGFDWPAGDILQQLGLRLTDLGLFGWTVTGNDRLYVPIRASARGQAAGDGAVRLTVRSASEIEKIQWRLYADGRAPSRWVKASRPQFAGDPVDITLPEGPSGISRVEIQAKISNSDDWASMSLRMRRGAR